MQDIPSGIPRVPFIYLSTGMIAGAFLVLNWDGVTRYPLAAMCILLSYSLGKFITARKGRSQD